MKKIISRNKSIALLLFLFGYGNLFASDGGACRAYLRTIEKVDNLSNLDSCYLKNSYVYRLPDYPHAFLYFKVPDLPVTYFDYPFRLYVSRRDKSIPILIEFNSYFLNPRKKDFEYYEASSRFKEKLIQDNPNIKVDKCLYFASGSEYRFAVPAEKGDLRIIIYFDKIAEELYYKKYYENGNYVYTGFQMDPYANRQLIMPQFIFKKGKEYELKIEVNKDLQLQNSYSSNFTRVRGNIPFNLNGFNISIEELPPNSKFAFDGKDDISKTYEDVKKEFVIYDDKSKYIDPRISEKCYYENLSDWWNNRCTEEEKTNKL